MQRATKIRPSVRLMLRALEDRTVPTTFTVTNTLDGSPAPAGSLRAAVASANAHSGADSKTLLISPKRAPHPISLGRRPGCLWQTAS